jgi:NAD-dependent DNA ligase
MNKVKQYLDQASIAYYSGSPTISDEVFDRLADSIGYSEVGSRQHEHVKEHFHRMYSLQKFYEDEGAAPLAEYKDIVVTPKLDGAAISILYINGNLTQVLTRGDGREGTDITDKFIARKDLVPLTVERKDVFQVIGEVVSPKEVPNSRNYAAGSLNLKDLEEFKTRAISVYAYGVYPSECETFKQDLRDLQDLGFETVLANDLHNIYPCDGLVFRLNNNKQFEELGYTSKHPRGAYAKKDRQESVETQLVGVEWQVGKSGKVTPVAILKPVMIGDKEVSRATLNNQGFIETLGICIGDTVAIALAGMIIPQVLHKVDA